MSDETPLAVAIPTLIVYRVLPTNIQMIAIAHSQRRPGYWKRERFCDVQQNNAMAI
jgi:hypothetical protein